MKRCLLVLIILVLLLTGCDQSFPKEVGHDTVLYTQVETIFEHSELEKAQEEKLHMETFCDRFQIKQYKIYLHTETHEKYPYTICKTTKGLYFCLFDKDYSFLHIEKITFSPDENCGAVNALQLGMTYVDAYQADPDGHFPYRLASYRQSDRYSIHWFKNGKCFMMVYKDDVITEIHYLTI